MYKKYSVGVIFAYKNDVEKYGEKLSEEDLKKGNYNETYTLYEFVEEANEYMAIARAMEILESEGWCSGNHLYVINVKVRVREVLE